MNRIVLIGYMYSGKSTFGSKIAKRLNYEFVDLDKAIEQKYHYTVEDIFAKFSEDIFRQIEKDMLKEVLKKEHIVIASGGGTPCFNNNMRLIKQEAISLYLQMSAEQLFSRMSVSKKPRPMLSCIAKDKRLEFIKQSLKQREKYYLKADIVVDGFNPNVDKTVEEILAFDNHK